MSFSRKKISAIGIVILVSAIVSVYLSYGNNACFDLLSFRKGTVAAKGIITDDNGTPVWVEYDKNGKVIEGGQCQLGISKTTSVPSLNGIDKQSVISTISSAKLIMGNLLYSFSDDVEPGIVMGQSPEPGTTVPEESCVNITVSLGKKFVTETFDAGETVSCKESGVQNLIDINVVSKNPRPEDYLYYTAATGTLRFNMDSKGLNVIVNSKDYGPISGEKEINDFEVVNGKNTLAFQLTGGPIDPNNPVTIGSVSLEAKLEYKTNYTGYVQAPLLYMEDFTNNESTIKLKIDTLGLKWDGGNTKRSNIEKGRIVAQSIPGGEWVKPGTALGVDVSDGGDGGTKTGTLGLAVDKLKNAMAMSAGTYNQYANNFYNIQKRYPGQWEIVTTDDYEARVFQLADGSPYTNKPPLKSKDTYHVVVRKKSILYTPYDELVLMESPINLEKIQSIVLDDTVQENDRIKSVLVNRDERYVLFLSKNNIGYKAAYYSKDSKWDGAYEDLALGGYNPKKDKLWAPLRNIKVMSSMSVIEGDGIGFTDSDGDFVLRYFIPACCGFSYTFSNQISAELSFIDFNPKSTRGHLSTYVWRPVAESCMGFSAAIPVTSLAGAMNQIGMMDLEASMDAARVSTQMNTQMNLTVDVAWLSGWAEVANESVKGDIPQTETTVYDAEIQPPEVNTDPNGNKIKLDLDGDAITDTVQYWKRVDTWVAKIRYSSNTTPSTEPDKLLVYYKEPKPNDLIFDFDWDLMQDTYTLEQTVFASGKEEYYADVWLNGKNPDVDPPDVVRLADYTYGASTMDQGDRGLVKSMSVEDIENTDVFIFRESNDQLVSRRKGLKMSNAGPTGNVVEHDPSKSKFGYCIKTRGPVGTNRYEESFEVWGARTNLNPELCKRSADHLRAGEMVKVILLNRATGYIGTGSIAMGDYLANHSPSGLLNLLLPPIKIRPPNLKVYAERVWIQSGATNEVRENLIGFEGSGLVSDDVIKVTTEWYNWDGSVLPSDITGYTGRIAKVVDQDVLSGEGDENLGYFEIKPGKHTQIIKLPKGSPNDQKAHYYIQVSGEGKDGNPDFETLDAGGGILSTRPAHYVPIKVGVFDEQSTRMAELVRRGLIKQKKEEDPNYVVNAVDFPTIDPIYKWAYRPEMQFSLFDLQVGSVSLTDMAPHNTLGQQTDETKPYISYVDFLYTLLKPNQSELTTYHPDKQLVVSVNGRELLLDQQTTGDNAMLHSLFVNGAELYPDANSTDMLYRIGNVNTFGDVSADDYLTLKVYQNGDDYNVLWQLEFAPLIQANPENIILTRTVQEARFEPEERKYVDEPFIVKFKMLNDAKVSLKVLDEHEVVKGTYIKDQELTKGDEYMFYLDYNIISKAQIPDDQTFYVDIEAVEKDDSYARKIRYKGTLKLDKNGPMLGQNIIHDVLIPDGSLNLSREDLSFAGRGPGLEFSRSYNNQNRKTMWEGPMGDGWDHNYDMRLVAYEGLKSQWTTEAGLSPEWCKEIDNARKFFKKDDLKKNEEWVLVQVNGVSFLRDNNAWKPDRGHHGKLEETTEGEIQYFVFTAKDGTKYKYPKPKYIWNSLSEGEVEAQSTYPVIGVETVRDITDRNGNKMTFEYVNPDKTGNPKQFAELKSVTDAVGRKIYFTYQNVDVKGVPHKTFVPRLVKVEGPVLGTGDLGDSENTVVNFTYNDKGFLKSATRSGRAETYEYDLKNKDKDKDGTRFGYNLIKAVKGSNPGKAYVYTYGKEGDFGSLVNIPSLNEPWDTVKTVTYPKNPNDPNELQAVAHFGYNPSASQRTVKDFKGNDTVYTLNNYGNPISRLEPQSKITTMTWSITEGKPDNVMTSKTVTQTVDGSDIQVTTFYEYDANGNVTSEQTGGHSITATWNGFSQPLTRKDINGVVQSWTYDPHGNLKEYTDGNLNTFSYTYYPTGEVQTATTPASGATPSGVTTYTYDDYGNPETVKKPLVPAVSYEYDIRGRLMSSEDSKGVETIYTYDDLDYPDTAITTPFPSFDSDIEDTHLAHVIDKDYDAEGNLLKENDRNGLVLTYEYTARNQVRSVTRTNMNGSPKKQFTYDANGNLLTETDWKGRVTTHEYDALNRKTRTIKPNHTDAMTLEYDAGGNLSAAIDYEGRITRYTYDILGRQRSEIIEKDGFEVAKTTKTYAIEPQGQTSIYSETIQTFVTVSRAIVTKLDYDGLNKVVKKTISGQDPADHVHTWHYGPLTNLEWEVDEEGKRVDYTYDNQGRRLSQIRHLDGKPITTTYGYDDNDNPIQLTVNNGVRDIITHTDYDVWNRAIATRLTDNEEEYKTTAAYNGMGQVVKTVDARNIARYQKRDLLGRVIQAVDGAGKKTSLTYDDNDNVLTSEITSETSGVVRITNTYDPITDLLNHVTETDLITGKTRTKDSFIYDKMGNLTQTTDFKGITLKTDYNGLYLPWKVYAPGSPTVYTETLYTKNGWVSSVTDRNQNTTTYTYNDIGKVIEETSPEYPANPIITEYDNVGNVTKITDRRGIETLTTYDDLHRLKTVTKAGLLITTHTYDDLGNLATVKDAKGNITQYEYNDRNLLVKTIFPSTPSDSGTITELREYDGSGNLKRLTGKDNNVTLFDYDNENRQTLIQIGETNSEITRNMYDISGNLISVTKPKGNCRIMDYDGFGRLIKVTDDPTTPKDTHASSGSANLVTTYEYDNNNNLVHTRTPKDNSGSSSDVEYTYDNQNRKTSHIQHQSSLPDITTQYTSYDNNGNLKELIDPNGRHIAYDYDTLNRQTDAHYASVGSPYYETTHIHTEYDKNNNVTRITETKTGAAGSLTDITDNSEYDNFDRLKTTTERGKTIHYDYDVNGNRTLVSSDAGSTTYSYDARNRLEWADQNTHKTFYTYYPDDRPDTVTFPNGTETVYTYYPETNRVKTITNTVVLANSVISSFDYTYDPNGNRTKQIEVQNGVSETTDYSFDTMDRLTGYTLSGADTLITGYTFEGYNRKSETVIKNALITTSREYTYNDVNWLTKIDDTTDNANPFTIDYAYDNNGNTIHKSDSSLTNQDITYTYDSRNQLVQVTRGPPASLELLGQYDYNADGLRVRHKNSERGNVNYYYDGNSVLEERSADTDTLLAHYRYADRLLSLDTGAEVQYYLNDALGSTVNLTTDVGSVKVSYWLDPYGEIRKQEGTSVNRMVFTGQEHDEKTGLVYFGARYYDPDIARFITQDSYLGESGTPPSLHRYLYAYANPTVYIDLYGNMGVFFDGTGNDKNDPDLADTNVAKLHDTYDDGPRKYIKGVGSDWWTKYTLGGLSGAGGDKRLESAYAFIVESYNSDQNFEKVIDVFGFSRGAAMARAFANIIKERGIPDHSKQIGTKQVRDWEAEERMRARDEGPVSPIYKEVPVYENFKDVSIRFLGIFDTVGSFGVPGNKVDIGLDFSVDPRFVENARHAVAEDEYRGLFDLQSVKTGENAYLPPNVIEKGFRGAHSDVGGGYKEGEGGKSNGLANIPLHWMYGEANNSGVQFKPLKKEDDIPCISKLSEKELTEKYIHDSRYFWEKYIFHRKTRDIFYQKNGKDYKQPFTKLNDDELRRY